MTTPAATVNTQYPKGDLRRMLSLLNEIAPDTAPDEVKLTSTLVKLVARTGLDKKSVVLIISQAIEQASVEIKKEGAIYTLVNWGPVFKPDGARKAARGKLEPVEASKHLIMNRRPKVKTAEE